MRPATGSRRAMSRRSSGAARRGSEGDSFWRLVVAIAPSPRAAQRLADAMRQLPGGVCVITAGLSPNRTGYTGTAVFSLSVDPERVVISVGRDSSSYPAIRDAGVFGLNVLSADQQAVADRFAGRAGTKGEARFEGVEWTITPSGASLLVGAL